jgi:hypothetical protein
VLTASSWASAVASAVAAISSSGTARAENHRFGLLSALQTRTYTPYKIDFLRGASQGRLIILNAPGGPGRERAVAKASLKCSRAPARAER